MNATTRKFARSLSEAFPKDHACAIEHHRSHARIEWWAGVALAIALGVTLALFFIRSF
jgi:hypothetical protein